MINIHQTIRCQNLEKTEVIFTATKAGNLIILFVASSGCKTWSVVTIREEYRLSGAEQNRAQREATGRWRKLHNEELQDVQTTLHHKKLW